MADAPASTAAPRGRLSLKLALAAAGIALAIGSALTALQIYADMRVERARIDTLGAKLIQPLQDSLTRSAFRLDRIAAHDLLTAIVQEPAVIGASVIDDFGDTLVAVSQPADRWALQNLGRVFGSTPVSTEIPLVVDELDMPVGRVTVQVDPIVAAADFSKRTAIVLAAGLLKSLLLSLVLSWYFMRTTMRRIERLSRIYAPAGTMSDAAPRDEIDALATALRQREAEKTGLIEALDLSVERVKLATSAASLGIWDMDIVSGRNAWDDAMLDLYEIAPGGFEQTYEGWLRRVHPDDVALTEARFAESCATGETFVNRFRIRTDTGAERVLDSRARIIRAADGTALRAIGVSVDVTEDVRRERSLIEAREATEAALRQSAYEARHDALTGLGNRRSLERHLRKLGQTLEGDGDVCFLHIDLDRFKSINDAFGHAAGDFLLVEIAKRLRMLTEPRDFIARIGGDEFSIVLDGPDCVDRATRLGAAIIEACAQPTRNGAMVLRSGASVGIALARAGALCQIQEDADIALYDAKRRGRGRHAFFNSALRVAAEKRKVIADNLTEALAEGRLQVWLQPQICARSRALHGVEALVRWHDPVLGETTPCDFLPVAAESDLLAKIDAHVFAEAMAMVRRIRGLGHDIPRLSVNVSLERLFAEDLLSTIDAQGDWPCHVAFELLETIDFDRFGGELAQVLQQLRDRGIEIEIDDFGSGRASVSALSAIRPDRIKLDRSITRIAQETGTGRAPLVKALADMGRALGIGLTAEGVETLEQAHALKALGCDVLQGYHLARPMPEDAFLRWIERHRTSSLAI
ncbi:putative bifunctional diguanylate cyclase/phosphodiesterase [Citreimonas sp.]|uniref:putative bifunctional diguanylate cyclase/phosphodiesterase n=1 Tax=Citreimonas sp. TaxID=3036715 RepID=UPI0035C7BE4B